jgi:5'(3')-deoxyribonucleotidase
MQKPGSRSSSQGRQSDLKYPPKADNLEGSLPGKPANKPIIAVDIDDVLSALNENIMHFMNRKYGYSHTLADYYIEAPYWNYWAGIWGVTPAETDKRVEDYIQSGELFNQQLLPGALKTLKALKKEYEFVVITSRDDIYTDATHKWLDEHFEDIFHHVRFIASRKNGHKITKAQVCREIGASYLIDDNAEHCNLAAKAGVQALLFGEYGWNKNAKLHKNTLRTKNWQEVLEYFENESR